MGILNVTPDSFSDGGQFLVAEKAVSHARQMISEGADIIDIGGESTRPGAEPVSVDEECSRVIPVIEAIRREADVAISCDTSKADVIQSATSADVDLINDVYALRGDGALQAAADSNLPICLMHMQGEPRTMQDNPTYTDLLGDIRKFFDERIAACEIAGIAKQKLILDVGFGFGKTPEHNLTLINQLSSFLDYGLPLLVGLSRKSTIGRIVDDRLIGSLAGALVALERGAKIVRVHDVAETVTAIRVQQSILAERVINE